MRKITMEDFIEKIRENIKKGEVVTYHITDTTFSVWKDRNFKEREYLDIPEENKYEAIFEKLQSSFWSENMCFWDYKDGLASGQMTIASTVVVHFSYNLLEGVSWLYEQYKNS